MVSKAQIQTEAIDIGCDVIASVCWCIGVTLIAAPNGIAPCGISGIVVLLNYLFRLPIGATNLAFNIPLMYLAYRILGRKYMLRTLRTLLIYTVLTDYVFSAIAFTYQGETLLAGIFGGIFNGAGTALVFMRGSTSGGIDIINRIIQKNHPYFSTGQISLVMNIVVMAAAALVYRDINAALYGIIFSFSSSRVVDGILNGADMGKCVIIITQKPEAVAKHVIEELHRSATLLPGKGAYLHDDVSVLICVVRKQQFFRLKRFLAQEDPKAFAVVTDATQILGKGFRSLTD